MDLLRDTKRPTADRSTAVTVPLIPSVQGRKKFIKISRTYITPERRIVSQDLMQEFRDSEAFLRILDFIQSCSNSVIGIKTSQEFYMPENIQKLLNLLEELSLFVDEILPIEHNQRFGNVQFRTWLEKVESIAAELHEKLLPNDNSIIELIPYFINSFGNKSRLDYGSGHELAFTAWLLCLNLIGFISDKDYNLVVIKVFQKYLSLVRKLQTTYNLEPAGSHGVWGLDDYQFLPYFYGASQLIGHPKLKPKSIMNKEIVECVYRDFMYFECIHFINTHKKGPFYEHSPVLFDISGVLKWEKVNGGMLKMYMAEVLGKFPVVQHFLFGSLLPFEKAEELPICEFKDATSN